MRARRVVDDALHRRTAQSGVGKPFAEGLEIGRPERPSVRTRCRARLRSPKYRAAAAARWRHQAPRRERRYSRPTAQARRSMTSPFARDESGEVVQHRSAAEHVAGRTAERIRKTGAQIVSRRRLRCGRSRRTRKEPVHDLGGADRLREKIDQANVARANGFDIGMQSRQRIPLKAARRIDVAHLVVVQQIEHDVLLQPLAEQRRQADDPHIGEMPPHPLLQLEAMPAVGVIARRIDRAALVERRGRIGIDVDGRDQDQLGDLHRRQHAANGRDCGEIGGRILVGDPFDCGNAGMDHQVERAAAQIIRILRIDQGIEGAGAMQRAPDKAGIADQRRAAHSCRSAQSAALGAPR